jgi:hypothetical protein
MNLSKILNFLKKIKNNLTFWICFKQKKIYKKSCMINFYLTHKVKIAF